MIFVDELGKPEGPVLLPDDSWVIDLHRDKAGVYAADNAIYVLRPLPPADKAKEDHILTKYIKSKGTYDWPEEHPDTEFEKLGGWFKQESFSKSLSIAYRYDGHSGFAFAFPFFIIKHFEDPMAGGWIVHRMYLKDQGLRDFGWMLMYAPSASRWVDGYLSAGVEWDVSDIPDDFGGTREKTEHLFVLESGVKLRVNMKYSPVKFLAKITPFWGFRAGLKYSGNAWDFRRLGLILEVGAGTF